MQAHRLIQRGVQRASAEMWRRVARVGGAEARQRRAVTPQIWEGGSVAGIRPQRPEQAGRSLRTWWRVRFWLDEDSQKTDYLLVYPVYNKALAPAKNLRL